MKAALFLPHLGVTGGQGVYCRLLLRALLEQAGDLQLVVFLPGDSRVLFPHSGIDDGWREITADARVSVRPIDWPKGHPLADPLDAVLAELLRAERPDVLHCSYYSALLEPVCPQVVTYHDAGFLEFPEYYGESGVRRRRTADRILPRVDRILTISADARERLSRLLPFPIERIDFAHHTLTDELHELAAARSDAARRVPLWPAGPTIADWGEYVFTAVGAATGIARPRKNIPNAVRAFRRSGLNLKMAIASNGILHPKMLDELLPAEEVAGGRLDGQAWTSADGRIVLMPDLERSAFLAAMAHARAVVYPSRYEGFGLPVIESMALEVPLVACRATCIPEVAGDAALLVDPDDVPGMSDAIRRVVLDRSVGEDLIARGRRRLKHFSLAGMGRAALDCYLKATMKS